jgi:hypothetical protein
MLAEAKLFTKSSVGQHDISQLRAQMCSYTKMRQYVEALTQQHKAWPCEIEYDQQGDK